MTSIGAVHTGEQDFADRTYEALYHLLLDFDNSRGMDVGRDLWPAQAALLCSQFGVLNDSVERSRQAERQLLLVASFLRSSLAEVEIKSTRRDSDWSTWTFLETYFRLAACKMATAGMLLAIDPGSVSIIAQQETRMVFATDDEVWEAPTETIWRERFQAHGCAYDIEVPVVSHTLMAGTEVYCFVSSFGLFALIASVWTHIVSCERLQLGLANNFDLATRNRLEATLQAWQTMWSDYFELRESKCLSSYPIMEDCLPLLTSCYYHLYVGPELRQLKALAIQERTGERIPIPAVGDLAPTLKAVRYAVQAWQVRLHHGIARTKLAGPLQCSPQTLTCAFEAALILAWWIYSTNDSERNPLNTTSNAEQDQLQGQLRSIYRELEEQGWCDESMPVWSRPLLSIRDMVCTGAWPYAEKMRRLLLTFYDRLARIDANRSRQQIDVTISDA
ncbi:Hypothetical protein D9617_39g039280 [Elsinoe fawcettii]|nr:Hypothetical protein D9617_39g039280 [Elsinoe fawcettii]